MKKVWCGQPFNIQNLSQKLFGLAWQEKCNDENDDKGFLVLVLMLLLDYCCKGICICANAWIFLFVYLFVCISRFVNFARGKWSNHDSKNCSEIRTVTWLVIWLWKLKISIFVCLFVYFFVCTSRFANFAKGKWSNHDFKNCSEIRTVTWSVI